MAIFRLYQSLDMNRYDLRSDTRTVATNETIQFGADGEYLRYSGAIWHPDGYEPSGTLRGISAVHGGTQHFSIHDFARPILEPFEAMQLEGDSRKFFRLILEDDDRIQGSRTTDTLSGFGGDDRINAGGGNDKVKGGGDDDDINGGRGGDKIQAGQGDDRIDGGEGSDVLHGGGGRDTFVFSQNSHLDLVRDFDPGRDHIEINTRPDVSFEDLTITRYHGSTLVALNDHSILVLANTHPRQIDEHDFIFT